MTVGSLFGIGLCTVWCLVGVSVNKPTNSRQTRGGGEGGVTTSAVQRRQGWEQVAKFGEVYEASGGAVVVGL